MLVSVWGKRWRETVPVMFSLYIDDSGTSPSQPVAIATALIVPAAQIIRLENEWEKFRKKEDFECFHTSEFYFRNPRSEFANWDDDKWARVFKRVCQITKKYGSRAISIAVLKGDYDEIVPADLRNCLGNTHYGWAVRQLLTLLQSPRLASPREFIFQWLERKQPARLEIEDIMDQMQFVSEQNGTYGDYSDPHFRKSVGIPGLQCVDMVAWVSYQFAQLIYKKIELRKLVPEAWREFGGNLGGEGWLRAFTIRREDLEKSIKKAVLDGKAVQFFKDWEKARTK